MSDKPRGLQPSADFLRTVRGYFLPDDGDWREALDPEYWHNIVGRLKPGDRIEVHSADHRIQFEVMVFGANDRADLVRFDIGFRPIWPLDLELPGPIMREEPYRPRYTGNEWEVERVANGEVLARFPSLFQAREAIAALERRDTQEEKDARAPRRRRQAAEQGVEA